MDHRDHGLTCVGTGTGIGTTGTGTGTAAGPQVAVVGLGAMGLPMALRLTTAACVTGTDPDPARRELAGGHGLATAPAPAASADLVLVMVSTPQQLTDLLDDLLGAPLGTPADTPLGATPSEPAVRPGQVWVLCGTYGPEAVERAAARLRDRGAAVLDAPVTGGVAGAAAGSLLFFCAGPADAFARAEPLLRACGAPQHVGPRVGDGQRLKAVNQLLCTVHLVAAAEALHLCERAGTDPATALPLLAGGAAGSWMLGDRGPLMLRPPQDVRSAVDVFVKDAAIVADLAARTASPTPVLAAARAQLGLAHDLGLGAADDSRVIDAYRQTSTSLGETPG